MKKIVVGLIMVCMLLQSVVIGVSAVESSDIDKKIELLNKMGIITYDDEMDYTENEVTRELMAQIFLYFYNGERSTEVHEYQGEMPFSDLDSSYWISGDIMTLVERGCMSGFTDGTFRLEDTATQLQAIKSIEVILGYNDIANARGGWPNGFISVASELGLTKGMKISYDSPIKKGDFVTLLYNALNADVMELNYQGIEKITYEKGSSLMNNLGFFKTRGVVNATEYASLLGFAEAGEGKVVIEKQMYNTALDCGEYIGKNVEIYYKRTNSMDAAEVVYIEEYNNDIVKVLDEDIDSKTDSKQFYYTDANDRLKSINIDPEATLIFNGKKLVYYSIEHLKPKDGSVEFIDANKDGVYETINVKSYSAYYVSNISYDDNEMIISDQYGKAPVVISMSDDVYSIKKKGQAAQKEDITRSTVVSIAADVMKGDSLVIDQSSTKYEIIISGYSEEGVISSYSGTDNEITINNSVYSISPWYDETKNSIKLNKPATVYLSDSKEVVAISYDNAETYGFLLSVYPAEDTEDEYYFKIYTETQEILKYKASEKIKIDNKKFDTYESAKTHLENGSSEFCADIVTDFINAKGVEQLIRFTVSNEEISTIDTVLKNFDDPNKEKECFTFNAKISPDGNGRLYHYHSSIAAKYVLSKDVRVFTVPQDVSKENSFGVSTSIGSSDYSEGISVSVFDADDFNVTEAVLKIGEKKTTASVSTNTALIVSSMWQGIDSEDEPITIVSGRKVVGGETTEVKIAADVEVAKNIQKGDIIWYSLDAEGIAETIRIGFSYKNGAGDVVDQNSPTATVSGSYGNTQSTQFYSTTRWIATKVYDLSEDYMVVQFNDGTKEVYSLAALNKVLLCDTSERGNITDSTIASIKTIKDFGLNNASTVFIYNKSAQTDSVVVFR